MPTRTLALACAAAAAVATSGCLSLPAKKAGPSPVAAVDGKATTARPVEAELKLPLDDAPVAIVQSAPVNPTRDEPPLGDTVELLRRQSESHAKALEALLSKRAAEPASPPPRASAVQWLDPSAFRLSLGDESAGRADQPTAGVAPADGPIQLPANPPIEPPSGTPAAAASAGVTDASNLPLELADAAEKPTVALVTNVRPADPSPSPVSLSGAADGGMQSRLAKRIRENPRDVASHLDYQLMLFLLDEQVPNLAAISSLPQEDRELVTSILDGLSNLRATLRRDVNLMIGEKIKPIVELSERLKTRAELSVPTLVLAKRVEGFGRYEVMDPRFIGGQKSPAIVYCEIDNFSSQFNTAQQWETNLTMEVVLFSEMGQQVFNDPPASITDTSRSKRRDFFVRKLVEFPANLTIGRYVLKVTIVDTQSNRVAEMSLPVQIVAG